jgi:phosphotransferase system, enzyme I, PtsP
MAELFCAYSAQSSSPTEISALRASLAALGIQLARDKKNTGLYAKSESKVTMPTGGSNPESSLLLTLEEISQLVSHSHDPRQTLANIVHLIQKRFHSDVCSVYLLEPERGELVLGATVGLRPEGIGRVRMHLNEGLTGLVAEKMAPVMVDDAFSHPRFKYFPEAGEDRYHSFLGVPLVEGGDLQGVLVVQTLEPRTFSTNETRLLVTVAAQLAPLVTGTRLLERVVSGAPPAEPAPVSACAAPSCLTGVALSPGVGVGEAYLLDGFDDWQKALPRHAPDPAHEARRLAAATQSARAELVHLAQRISDLVGQDYGAILQAQLMFMQDRTIEHDLGACLEAGSSAEGALLQVLDKYVATFQKLSTPFWKERVYDVKDVFRRLLWHVRQRPTRADAAGARVVLVAHEASVMDLFSVDLDRLAAVVVERDGPQSHAAILARSLGVPMVAQVPEIVRQLAPGRLLLVDGARGVLHLDPTAALLSAHEPVAAHFEAALDEDPASEFLPPGVPRLEANINLIHEVPQALARRAGGVGLFRSEFLFLARRTFPTEEEQVGTYRKLLGMLRGRPASIRTFDLRPDKLAHAGDLASVEVGPLDWRLVLSSPTMQKLFKDQVRAILRAAAVGPARILVPMVTRTEQLDYVLKTVSEARAELQAEGLDFGANVPLGVMIEVAAAALLVEAWAERVDFFTIGTNDLLASALGIDRENPVGTSRNDPLHPGMLRLVRSVVRGAHQAGRRVSVCGEMAADPEGALALAILQVDALSVAVHQLGPIRRLLVEQSADHLEALAPQLLHLHGADQVRDFLRHAPRSAAAIV